MNDQPGRPARRPLAQPFSHQTAAVDQPLGERLLPVQHLDPFTGPAPVTPDTPVQPARPTARPLGPGGLAVNPGE
ncbi:hypothetical protein ACIRRH_41665 [Kitasatospora sp. NPDC101235]|uniref:hypothetical protein n=1 Tax=Kitasatospora sp. NPDC101235 TaxID=3364101 RepID=UPI003818D6A4